MRRIVIFCFLACLTVRSGISATALDDYINTPDPAYTYSVENTVRASSGTGGYTVYQIRMISQRWRSMAEVDEPLWRHWLQVVIPDIITNDTALLIIEGGSTRSKPPNIEQYAGMMVGQTGAVLALLQQVPNQPLRFAGEQRERKEDAIIAYSYDKFLATGDPTWPALLPMTKSAVRAMDTVQALTREKGKEISKFIVGGGSKRGWTTWLTAAVDKRVNACVPIVIDVLKMKVQMEHQFKAYGTYSDAVDDYVQMNIFGRFDLPEAGKLLEIVDPYTYLNRYTMPKFIVNSTGDEFFLLDASRFYYDQLPDPKILRYFPNSGHGINADISAALSLLQYFMAVSKGEALPSLSWTFEADGSLCATTDGTESQALLWQATNPDARDFRWYKGQGPQWSSAPLTPKSEHTYVARVDNPLRGWTAFMIEMSYPSGLVLTTEVRVLPDCLPYDDSDGDGQFNKIDNDDDNDGYEDANDDFPCDADNNGIPDVYERTGVGGRVQPGSAPPVGKFGSYVAIAVIFGILIAASLIALRLLK